MIEADGITIYNSGDTGYARHFSELPELFPHIDYCMIGIGAYKPRWFMKLIIYHPMMHLRLRQI